METIGAVVGVLCFLGIAAVVVAVMVRQRARAEENKYRLEAKIQGLDDEEVGELIEFIVSGCFT